MLFLALLDLRHLEDWKMSVDVNSAEAATWAAEMKLKSDIEWLKGELRRAEGAAEESAKRSINSYGSGYDAGYVEGLKNSIEHFEKRLSAD